MLRKLAAVKTQDFFWVSVCCVSLHLPLPAKANELCWETVSLPVIPAAALESGAVTRQLISWVPDLDYAALLGPSTVESHTHFLQTLMAPTLCSTACHLPVLQVRLNHSCHLRSANTSVAESKGKRGAKGTACMLSGWWQENSKSLFWVHQC